MMSIDDYFSTKPEVQVHQPPTHSMFVKIYFEDSAAMSMNEVRMIKIVSFIIFLYLLYYYYIMI